jgi:hypothetical protein
VADRFYGVALGGQLPVNVTEGAATGGAAAPFELRINDTVYANRVLALAALEAIKNYLQTKETTPIA